jgi:hypothetical protein
MPVCTGATPPRACTDDPLAADKRPMPRRRAPATLDTLVIATMPPTTPTTASKIVTPAIVWS